MDQDFFKENNEGEKTNSRKSISYVLKKILLIPKVVHVEIQQIFYAKRLVFTMLHNMERKQSNFYFPPSALWSERLQSFD